MDLIEEVFFRDIQKSDNEALAKIIRNSLKEYREDLSGTVFEDPTTDDLFALFSVEPRSHYYVIEDQRGNILGGGGIYHSEGLDKETVELVKMYLLPSARGKKYGYQLINLSIRKAKEMNFKQVYIETLPELKEARSLYEKYGFEYITEPKGNTGHTGCDVWMKLDLE
jgi:putative acetyltransferase